MGDKEIKFDILKIDSSLEKDSKYIEGENIFQFFKEYNENKGNERDEKIDYPKYLAYINLKPFKFLGILSKNLIKESYGYITYENGDEYFGQWKQDKKEGYGIYYFKDEKNDTFKNIYIGEFTNNVKSGEGIYFDIYQFEQENDFLMPKNFSILLGVISESEYKKGMIINFKDRKRVIFKGEITPEGKKKDGPGELYEENNKIFIGDFKDNKITEGRIIITNNDNIERAYNFKKIEEDIELIDKDGNDDQKYIKYLKELNEIFKEDEIKNLYVDIVMIRTKLNASGNIEYMNTLNFDTEIKLKFKDKYGKYLYY
jgi:hypothetical protein